MKIVTFMIVSAILSSFIAWLYLLPTEKKFLNLKTYLTMLFIASMMLVMFMFASVGSLFTLKVF